MRILFLSTRMFKVFGNSPVIIKLLMAVVFSIVMSVLLTVITSYL